MSRPIQVLIHQQALAHNLQQIRQLAPNQRMFAVVKANGYGHGLNNVFEPLKAADGFATLEIDSAQSLRELGWRGPILLLEGVFEPRDLEICSRLQLWHVVHNEQQIDWLAQHKTAVPHRVFLKLNLGMNRLGFVAPSYRTAWARLNALPQVGEISLMGHFSDADRVDVISNQQSITRQQLQRFQQQSLDLPGERSLCNSIAALKQLTTQLVAPTDWIRAGYALYGGATDSPHNSAAAWQLQPAMTFAAQIIATQQLQAGATIGYSSTFTADADMRIGVVACGYADGYPFNCGTGTPVLINGRRSRIVGRVNMDMLTVDLTEHPQAGIGSWVTLWGRDKALYEQTRLDGSSITAVPQLPLDEVALHANSIGYELCCKIMPRIRKLSVD